MRGKIPTDNRHVAPVVMERAKTVGRGDKSGDDGKRNENCSDLQETRLTNWPLP